MIENSQAWLGASTSAAIADFQSRNTLKLKAPTWTQNQLKEAVHAVVTQRMRFTQAATYYGIPKGTLYDNVLGKSNRMDILHETGMLADEEDAILEFCCDTSVSPYNRRTNKTIDEVLDFVLVVRRNRDPDFSFVGLTGFRWWWAFRKKHSIVSLHYKSPSTKIKSKAKIKNEFVDESDPY